MLNWQALTPRERDILVADTLFDKRAIPLIPYSTSPTAVDMVEDEIERRGLVEEYTDTLVKLVTDSNASVFYSAIEVNSYTEWNGHRVVWAIARATPEQRCLAALRAVGVEITNGE